MSNDINLLHANRTHHSPILERRVRIFRTISVTFLFLVGVLSACLFIMSNFSPLPSLKAEEEELLAQFSRDPLRKSADSYFLTKVRSEDITKLLQGRSRLMQAYNAMTGNITESVTLKSLKVDRDSSMLSITSGSLGEIERVISEVKKLPESDQSIETIALSNILFDGSSGQYSVTIEIKNKQVSAIPKQS